VARAYRELENEGVIDVRHGSGAFVAKVESGAKAEAIRQAGEGLRRAIGRGTALGLTEPELRRVFEQELSRRKGDGAGREGSDASQAETGGDLERTGD